jgi:hypothetical protein
MLKYIKITFSLEINSKINDEYIYDFDVCLKQLIIEWAQDDFEFFELLLKRTPKSESLKFPIAYNMNKIDGSQWEFITVSLTNPIVLQ